jgi:hypothetical protein
VLGSKKI